MEWKYRGRVITAQDLEFIREFIVQHPGLSRRRLSARLCQAWEWKQANGALCDMVCRGLLLMLHRAGEIELPPVRQISLNPFVRRARPAPVPIDQTPLTGTLKEVKPIATQQVRRTAQEPLFNSLIEHHHYLGYEQPVGEHLKYLIWAHKTDRSRAWRGVRRRAIWAAATVISAGARGAPAQHPPGSLQHALSDPALDSGPASGLAYFGASGEPIVARLGADVRSSGLLRGNLHRSGPVSGDLLSRRQLAVFGADHGARQGFQQQTPQPLH